MPPNHWMSSRRPTEPGRYLYKLPHWDDDATNKVEVFRDDNGILWSQSYNSFMPGRLVRILLTDMPDTALWQPDPRTNTHPRL